ncbi:ATP-binding protein [Candidatus Woesearchaeota archaeon]|nr:ATP-binding protein [Candidatus Woesearchaeota archaeon]
MVELSELKKSNPWWENKALIENDFHLQLLRQYAIVWHYTIMTEFTEGIYSVRGPRQIGKTTWIKQTIEQLLKTVLAKQIFYYSCDILKDYNQLIAVIEAYLEFGDNTEQRYLFLDEIAFVDDWQIAIKNIYDRGLLRKCFLLITGSHSIDIKRNIERLPGRVGIGKRHFILFPLSFYEYAAAIKATYCKELTDDFNKNIKHLELYKNEIQKDFLNYCMTGGFLKAINSFHANNAIDESIYEIYTNWFIGDLAKWKKNERFSKQILKRIFSVYGTEISYNSLKSETEIDSHNTVADYISCLEELFILQFIYKLDFNKQIAEFPKNKKIYFFDPLLYYALYKWVFGIENVYDYSFKNRDNPEEFSKLVEGIVFNHFIKYMVENNQDNLYDYKDNIFYWKNKQKTKEMDLVVRQTHNSSQLFGIEIKWQNSINKEDTKILKEFEKSLLLSKQDFVNSKIMPVSCFLLTMKSWIKK